jgi:hypothetical protein
VRTKALWCIGLGLLAHAGVMVYTHTSSRELGLTLPAYGQGLGMAGALPAERMVGAKGIFLMPAQLGPNHYGAYLMDVDAGTITVYVAKPETSRLRLMAVRSFRYDRYLEDFNGEAPTPNDVRKLVAQQKAREELEGKRDKIKKDDDSKPTTQPE